jgi:hypothetical protein
MDAKWLARQANAKGTPSYAAMAREIIHQEAELAERTRELDEWKSTAMEHTTGKIRAWSDRDDAIRDRNEFAAQQVERVALTFGHMQRLCQHLNERAAELRAGAVPATEPKPEPAAEPSIDRLLDRWRECQNEADNTELAIDHTDADAARRAIHDAIAATSEGLRNRLAVAEELAATYAARGDMDAMAAMRAREKKFAEDLRAAINCNSAERIGGDTPDYLLAEFLVKCLEAFGMCTRSRTAWHVAERAGGAS